MADKILHNLLDSLDRGIPLKVTLTDLSVLDPAIVVRLDLYSVTQDKGCTTSVGPITTDEWPRAGGFVTLNNEPYLISDIKSVERL